MPNHIFLIILLLSLFLYLVSPQCCLTFQLGLCIQCPAKMHLYRHNCIFDIDNCIEYQQGFDCNKCRKGYQLAQNVCLRQRYNLKKEDVGVFSPYLHMAVIPDPLLEQAQTQLKDDLTLWQSYINYTAFTNRTFLTQSSIRRKAEQTRTKVLGPNSTLHFISNSTSLLNSTTLNLYRLTYLIPSGYADLLFLVQSSQSLQIDYLQIVAIIFSDLGPGNWQVASEELQNKIGQMLGKYFLAINGEEMLKGFWLQGIQGYNITLFYLDGQVGVVGYSYVGTKEDLDELGIKTMSINMPTDILDGDNSNATTNSTQNSSSSNSSGHSGNNGTTTTNQTNTNTTTPSQPQQPVTPFFPYPQPTQTPNTTTNPQQTPTYPSPPTQQKVQIQALASDVIFATGYAVAVQQAYVPATAKVQGLSQFRSNFTFCIYFSQTNNNTTLYSQFMFYITDTFKVAYFTQKDHSLYPWNPINTTTNTTTTQTNPPKNVTITNDSTVTKVPLNDSSSTCPPNLQNLQSITISTQLKKDIFLPRIHLLLLTMYGDVLNNCAISEAKYHWGVTTQGVITNIMYNVTYSCTNQKKYGFKVEIKNNQLSIVDKPEELVEGEGLVDNEGEVQNETVIEEQGNKGNGSVANNSNSSSNSSGGNSQDNSSGKSDGNSSQTNNANSTANNNTNSSNATNSTNSTTNNNNSSSSNSNGTNGQNNSSAGQGGNQGGSKPIIIDNIKPIIIDNIKPSNFTTTPPQPNNTNNTTNNTANTTNTANIANNSTNANSSNSSTTQNSTTQNSTTQNSTTQNTTNTTNTTTPNVTTTSTQGANSALKVLVNQQQYTSNPKYKSIISIVKSIKRVPSNATLTSMQVYIDSRNFQYFWLTYTMTFKTPPNGSNTKIFSFEVEVNTSSYVTITKENIEYTKQSGGPLQSVGPLPSKGSSNGGYGGSMSLDNLLPLPFQDEMSYTTQLIAFLSQHSPSLRTMMATQLFFFKKNTDFGNQRSTFKQTLKFSSAVATYCYQIKYWVFTNSSTSSSYLQVTGYQLTNCSMADDNKFLYSLAAGQFQNSSVNENVNVKMREISGGELQIQSYEVFEDIYKVVWMAQSSHYEVIYSLKQQLLLFFCKQPKTLLGPTMTQLPPDHLPIFYQQISSKYTLNSTMLDIFMIKQLNSKEMSQNLVEISMIEKKLTQWGIQMMTRYCVQGMYASKEGRVEIYGKSVSGMAGSSGYYTNYYGLQKYVQGAWEELVNGPQFTQIMDYLQMTYPTFLQNCNLLAFLFQSPQSKQNFFLKTYSTPITLKILLLKRYTPSYSASYIITLLYTPNRGSISLKAVQSLPTQTLLLQNCTKIQNVNGLPFCNKCEQGFTDSDGKCWVIPPYCKESYKGICLHCGFMKGEKQWQCCDRFQLEQRELRIINLFYIGMGRTK